MKLKPIFLITLSMLLNAPHFLSSHPTYKLDKDLVIIDVGCRWGFADKFLAHLDDLQLYGFDADKAECDSLSKQYKSDRIHLVPIGLSNKPGLLQLFSTENPGCSSIYPPDQDLIDRFGSILHCMKEIGQETINVTTLDAWAKEKNIASIDYMKLDTQGSELLILEGGADSIKNTRILEVEVEFNPLYVGQPLFADVDTFLRKHGFVLWKFTNLIHYSPPKEKQIELGSFYAAYSGKDEFSTLRGGQLFWADAHYVRKELAMAKVESKQQLIRDIVLSEYVGMHDLASRLKTQLKNLNSK